VRSWKNVLRCSRAASGALGLALALLLAPAATAQEAPPFGEWLEEVRGEARQRGISEETIRQALDGIAPVQSILDRDRRQPEFTITFEQYRDRIVSPDNVHRGAALLERHGELLERVAARYGVQPRFIVAIWGIESRYGAVEGTSAVIPALATLAWDRRRATFFRNELMSALEMVDRGYIDLEMMKGSWAGAMGQPQFIPSSYLAYAQDFDGDGRRDIWTNYGDIFASIANYLAQHGWSSDQTWGREVRLPASLRSRWDDLIDGSASGCRAMRTMTQQKDLQDWQALGVRRPDGSALPSRSLPAAIVAPEGPEGPAFVVYRNYRSILRYNCAHLYALTVGILSDRIHEH
jgi:membrane-bound lytic murein transglycosylase B